MTTFIKIDYTKQARVVDARKVMGVPDSAVRCAKNNVWYWEVDNTIAPRVIAHLILTRIPHEVMPDSFRLSDEDYRDSTKWRPWT